MRRNNNTLIIIIACSFLVRFSLEAIVLGTFYSSNFYSSKGSKRHQPFVKNTQDTRNMATLSADASATLGNENNVEMSDYDIVRALRHIGSPKRANEKWYVINQNGLTMQKGHI